jgi:hypothetical protein
MNAIQIRTQLLTQHAELRALVGEARIAVGRVPMGRPEDDDGPAACMSRLASALRAHNLCEERLLTGVLVTADGWGPARAEIMNQRHAAEHGELHAALVVTTFDPEMVGQLLDRLLEHMAHEEQAFLGEDVLRDDTIVIDACGG